MRFRFLLLIAFFLVLYGLLGFNLYRLQIENGSYYIERAEALSAMQENLSLKRGQIFFTDRNQNKIPVAVNKDYPVIYAVPKEVKNPNQTAEILAPTINWDEKELAKALSNPESLFRLLVERASGEVVRAVKKLKIEGIYIDQKQHRFYPFGSLASHLLGFVGINEEYANPTGLYGVEKFYNYKLRDGISINLTIDRNIQAQVEQILDNLIEKFNAANGTIIVLEPETGKILALTNAHSFDPNDYSKFPIENFLNPSIQNVYEPGSVFKPITMTAGIDSGAITPDTTFFDTGSVVLNGKKITNWDKKAHGEVTMTNVIERSINTGVVFAVQKIGHENFHKYLKKFGFGEVTEIDLPDEVEGNLRNLENKNARDIDFATASFGQGTAVTPIQLTRAFGSLANGGLLMRPYLNADDKPHSTRRFMSEDTSKQATKMMESAVEKAKVAALPQYRIAGKTGTAQIPDFRVGGYTEEYIHTFVGFGPVSNPRFVALIKIEKPNKTLAGQTVVPAFKELAQFILSYYNVPPDKTTSNQ